jgi:hypothetical protein
VLSTEPVQTTRLDDVSGHPRSGPAGGVDGRGSCYRCNSVARPLCLV